MDRSLAYRRLACDTLGLVHPTDRAAFDGQLLNLGTYRIIESPAATQRAIEQYLKQLREVAQEFVEAFQTKDEEIRAQDDYQHQRTESEKLNKLRLEIREEIVKKAVLLPADFIQFNKRGDSEEKRESYSSGRAFVRDVARQELARLQRFTSFSSDFDGYGHYLDRACPDLYFRLKTDIPALVKEDEHTTHSYILATTRTGKSELLKALCLNYVEQPDYASVIVLDPGGDMTPEIARWPEIDPERLLYIEPAMSDTEVPVLNPFDISGLSHREKSVLTGQIVSVLGTLIEGKNGSGISVPMEAVLYPSVRLLLDLPNTSLADLPRIMRGDARLIALGKNSPVNRVAEFFAEDFDGVNKLTKSSITNKINSILGKGMLEAILCGSSSFDLKAALNTRKIVLVNLAKGALEPGESAALGMLLVALVQSIGMERVHMNRADRPQTHLIIDECQNFVTGELKSIIRETRKFGLAVTLAQQELGGGMPADLRDVVVKTTNVKIAGRSARDETKRTGDMVGIDPSDIQKCGPGEFYYQAGNKPAFKLRVRSDRIGNRGGIDAVAWGQRTADQKRRFYAPVGQAPKTARKPQSNRPKKPGSGFTFE